MKRIQLALLLLILSCTMLVRGQFIDGYGIKTGLSIANQSFRFTPIDQELPTDVLIGPGAFFFVEAFKGQHFSLQVDLGVMFKGCKSTAQSITINHLDNDQIVVNEGPEFTSAHQYFTFSPMARYQWDYSKISLYTMLGPRLDVLLNYASSSLYPLDEQKDKILGLTGAFGLEYRWKKLQLFTEIQYQPDLSPVTNVEPLLVNNNVLFVCIGVRM